LSVATVCATYLLIVWGGIVRVTGSGLGCDDARGGTDGWPLCAGGLLPPWTQAGVIEFTHRWLATITTVLVIALAGAVYLRYRHVRRLVVAGSITLALFVVQIILGAITVEFKLPPSVILIHLANAEILLGSLVFIAVTALTLGTGREVTWSGAPPKARLAAAAAVLTYLVLLSGSNVVAQGAGAACTGWPLCGGGLGFSLPQAGLAAVNVLHRFGAGALLLLIGATVPIVRKVHPGDSPMLRTGIAVNILLLLQIIAGAVLVESNLPTFVKGIHLALASALWAGVVLMALLARRPSRSAQLVGKPETVRVATAVAT
jgi:heme A synthase